MKLVSFFELRKKLPFFIDIHIINYISDIKIDEGTCLRF